MGVQENFLDSYANLTIKSVMMLKWFTQFCERGPKGAQYVLKTDDDMYINLVKLWELVQANKTQTLDGQPHLQRGSYQGPLQQVVRAEVHVCRETVSQLPLWNGLLDVTTGPGRTLPSQLRLALVPPGRYLHHRLASKEGGDPRPRPHRLQLHSAQVELLPVPADGEHPPREAQRDESDL